MADSSDAVAQASGTAPPSPPPAPPPNTAPSPKSWFITDVSLPLGYYVAAAALKGGDSVVAAYPHRSVPDEGYLYESRSDTEEEEGTPTAEGELEIEGLSVSDDEEAGAGSSRAPRHTRRRKFPLGRIGMKRKIIMSPHTLHSIAPERCLLVEMDMRDPSSLQSALSHALPFLPDAHIHILLNTHTLTVVSPLEPLPASLLTLQFSSSYFSLLALLRTFLPHLRSQPGGAHIINVTGVTALLGTPGLSVKCGAEAAAEGVLESLAYEVAPYGVRCSTVQPEVAVSVLLAPIWGAVAPSVPLRHHMQTQQKDKDAGRRRGKKQKRSTRSPHPTSSEDEESDDAAEESDDSQPYGPSSPSHAFVSRLLALPSPADPERNEALRETVHCITSIAGVPNPPLRLVVGEEGVEMTKEKLKSVSEEMEEFVDVSAACDVVVGA